MKILKKLLKENLFRDYEDLLYSINNCMKNITIALYNNNNNIYIEKEMEVLKWKEEKYNILMIEIDKNIEKNENYIPKNSKYCYHLNLDKNFNICPYWTKNPFAFSKDDGHCLFLGYGDKEINDIGTLCEQIKICDIK